MSAPIEGKATRTCFVYDKDSGEVVHIHQFVPWKADDTGDAGAIREVALAQASIGRGDHPRLDAIDIEGDHYAVDMHYRVKPGSRELLRERIAEVGDTGQLGPRDLDRPK